MATDKSTNHSSSTLLAVDNIRVQRSGQTLLSGVSLTVQSGEVVGLIGPNGAGKSTLLSIMAGLNKADSGQVKLVGRDLSSYSSRDRARHIGWMEQLATAHWPDTDDQMIVKQALTDTDCLHLKDRQVTTLSGGELTRVMLARALASEPKILLADEPIAALDIGHQLQTMDLLRDFVTADKACVVVLHDLSLAARYCDRLYLLHESVLVADGGVASVLSTDNLKAVYGVDVIAGCDEVPWIVPVRRSTP